MPPQFPEFVSTVTVTIANGTALSGSSGKLSGLRVCGYAVDAAFDTQAVTFQVSGDGSTWYNLYQESSEYTQAAVVASSAHNVDISTFLPWAYIKVRSGTAGAVANQVGDTVVTLFLRPI
jgi:hypothetical protein